MTVDIKTIRSDLKNLESSDKLQASIFEKYISIYKSDSKMSEIKKDVQVVQWEMILSEPNYKDKFGIYTLDKNGKIKFNSQKAKNEIPKSAINFSREFVTNGNMRKTKGQIDQKLYDYIKELKKEFTDARSNRWSTFVGRVKNAMNLAEKLKAKDGKTVKPKDKHIDLNLVESLFSSLFGKDIVNDKKPINKNAFAVRFVKSEEGYSITECN